MDEDKHFIIQDLDETHLLVSADSLDMIKQHLEEEVCHIPNRPDRHVSQLTAAIYRDLLLCAMSSSKRIPSSLTSDWTFPFWLSVVVVATSPASRKTSLLPITTGRPSPSLR